MMRVQSRFGLVATLVGLALLPAVSPASAQQFESIASFAGCPAAGCAPDDDAARPTAIVVGPDGHFYGIGGLDWRDGEDTARDWGTIFRQRADGTREILHRFDGTGRTGCGTLRISFGPDGALYGVGLSCYGYEGTAIFRLQDTSFQILQEFPPGEFVPRWMVAGSNGAFYGLAAAIVSGFQRDVLFKWDGAVTPLGAYQGTAPADLVLAPDGNLYFATRREHSVIELFDGFIYRLTSGDQIQVVYTFSASSGGQSAPADDLIVGSDGFLYGTRLWRYAGGRGPDLYKMTLSGQVLFNRPESQGVPPLEAAPDGSVFLAMDFGASIARLTPAAAVVPIHAFPDGLNTLIRLVRGPDGHYYGVRAHGGDDGLGTFFRIRMPSVDVKANGGDDPVSVTAGTPLQISLAFDASATEVLSPSEVYFAVVTPALQIIWTTPSGFSLTPSPLYSGPLPSFPSTALITIPDAAVLPPGDYYWVAIVDADANGVPNGHYVDFVKTTKMSAATALQRKR